MKFLFLVTFIVGVLMLTKYLVARAKKDNVLNAPENRGQKC